MNLAKGTRGRIEQSVELFQRSADVRPEDYQSPILLAQSLGKLGRKQALLSELR